MESSDILALIIIPSLLGSGIYFVLALCHLYYKKKFSYWEKLGVKGPEPIPFFGNNLERMYRRGRTRIEKEWVQKYGKVYGVYAGTEPHLVIADAQVLRQICTRDFEDFPNHQKLKFMNKYQKRFLIFLRDDEWKKMRALLSPTLTSAKIKQMFKFLEHCAEDLINCFIEQLGNEGETSGIVDAKDLYSLFTMDAIATCCYGLKLNLVGSVDLTTLASRDGLVKICSNILTPRSNRILASMFVPTNILNFFGFSVIPEVEVTLLSNRVKELLKNRRRSKRKFDDYLQLLLDARITDKLELNDLDYEENHHAGLSEKSLLENQQKMVDAVAKRGRKKIQLSDLEIVASETFLLFVALETTGALLTSCTYALAFHQEIQEELYKELMKIAKVDKAKRCLSFNYDSLTSCLYLDAVISETLRLFAPVYQMDRDGKNEYFIEKYNLKLPKGSVLNLAYYAILNDPDYWEEPDLFKPERFLPENREKIVPGSYCPFGLGPRHCVGMRFSLTEAKLALAKVVTSFHISPAPDTVFPPESKIHPSLNQVEEPLVKVELRVHNFD